MKKICIIYANCQGALLTKYLTTSASFNREYQIKRFPIHVLMQKKTSIPSHLLERAKLFIYQPVKEIHGELCSELILNKLPSDCLRISFPSLYFSGYSPQSCKNPVNKVIKPNYPTGLMAQGDTNIISMLESGNTTAQIIKSLSDPDFYSQEFLLSHLNETLAELARRESQLSIKVSQFIKANFQDAYLFYTRQHPSDILGVYVANQILNLLDLTPLSPRSSLKSFWRGVLDTIQVPIYPSVIKHLDLKFVTEKTPYRHFGYCTNSMTFSRYISEYVCLHQSMLGSANSYYFKGIRLADRNKFDEAAMAIKSAIKRKPDNAAYYGELAEILQKQNKLTEAKLAYKKAIQISPDWIDFYKSLGKILVAEGSLAKAILVYKQVARLEPQDEEVYSLLGDALINLKRLDLAEKCYLQAIKFEPTKAHYYRCLGDIYRDNNSLDSAVYYYDRAIALAPNNPWLYVHLSEVLVEQNKIERASQACKQSLKFKKSNKVNLYRRVGDLQLKIGSFNDAIDTYKEAIKLNPNNSKNVLRQIRLQMKQAAEARDCTSVS